MTWELHTTEPDGRRRWRCQTCGVVTAPTKHEPERIAHHCLAKPLPNLAERGAAFSVALARHAAMGFPKSGEEARAARLATCQACPSRRYDTAKEICKECGCACNAKAQFWNKLDWADEACPLGHWSALVTLAPATTQ